jgi:hypothetical protein
MKQAPPKVFNDYGYLPHSLAAPSVLVAVKKFQPPSNPYSSRQHQFESTTSGFGQMTARSKEESEGRNS